MSTTRLQTRTAPDGTEFRDLNGNGVMDPYEDPRLPVADRVADLLGRMTIEEKVGQFFQPSIEAGADGSLVEEGALVMPESTTHTVTRQHISHFNVLQLPTATAAARWHNRLQQLAEGTRLGVPVTISTDPRHSELRNENIATALTAGAFSAWPEAIGLAALRDVDAVREFARIARREYTAVGIRAALHPQVDLATEPRWARQSTTFGPDAALSSAYVRAYLEGFEDRSADGALQGTSVACMTKHFPGGGPQRDGEDPHFPYGKEQVYPGGMFDHHLEPFRAAIDAGTSAIMPYYGVPVGVVRHGRAIEEVAFGFNKQVITGILREELGYDGVVCTDWQLVSDVTIGGAWLPARAWGVEHLDRAARVAKILDAGCDQLGGETCTDVLLGLVESGQVAESRLDESLRRTLAVKFELGLFDDPYVDESAVLDLVGSPDAVEAGFAAQQRSMVVLSDDDSVTVDASTAVWVEGLDAEVAGTVARVVDRPEDADVRVVRIDPPFDHRDEFVLEPFFHAGTLEFPTETIARLRALRSSGPLVVVVQLERPAVLTPVLEVADVLIGDFGATDAAILAVVADRARAQGVLPFDLPRSMADVVAGAPDVPHDLADPLFRAKLYG
ncbi:glycoside hydrolase family 3 N-terminal domain-containing protein [Curtobacterium sp. BRB10]|uniref:glycoside hydrolase family 3 protein n=1 Tax=Curtobacterium sp. BRB10 TaxID=2962579 RepID=UPI002882628F|nr:glycoside hydrolase family 3 N-terminal domain-containing protein [Curtobacterium sp. BRB10]MDT0234854.1 glycoside hydrolase family 3 N-terminal domain-containing protein [Curtobacterium sp. BRB10]